MPVTNRRRREVSPPAPALVNRLFQSLLVLLRLAHDFLGGEVDAAGREGVADEEVVAFLRVEVLTVLEVRVFGGGKRQLHRLRNDLALERGDGGLDRNRNLGRTGAAGSAFQAFAGMRRAEFAEAVLGLAADGHEGMLRVHEGAHGTGRAALDGDAVEVLL